MREQLVHRRLLDLPSRVHHEHAVGDVGDDAEVVRDEDDRGAEPLADVAHQVEDARLDRHVERRRRLVRDEHLRVAGQRHRDHHALPHAAGELVRILAHAAFGRRDADELEQLHRAAVGRLARQIEMPLQHLGDLPPDPESRVERRHRLLEHERDLAPADPAGSDAATPTAARYRRTRRAVDLRARRQQPQQAHQADALPAARLADDAEHLALAELERQIVDRLHDAVVGVELDAESVDREDRASAYRVVRGSRTSRRPSPSRLNESEQKKIARPGYTASLGAVVR